MQNVHPRRVGMREIMRLYTILLVLYVLKQFKFKSLFLIKPHPCALFQSYRIRISRGKNRNMNFQHISWTIILHTKVEEQPRTKLLLDGSYFNPTSSVEKGEWAVTEQTSTPASQFGFVHCRLCRELGYALQNKQTMV